MKRVQDDLECNLTSTHHPIMLTCYIIYNFKNQRIR